MLNYFDVIQAQSGVPVDDIWAQLWGTALSDKYVMTEYTGTLPATLTGTKAGYLESYKIYGNTEQTGTPTPDNPIMPSGCGERTENLFDNRTRGYYNNDNGIFVNNPVVSYWRIPVQKGDIIYANDKNVMGYGCCFYQGEYVPNSRLIPSKFPYTVPDGVDEVTNNYPAGSTTAMVTVNRATPTSYIPYGYKLPMISRTENLFDKNSEDNMSGYSIRQSTGEIVRGQFFTATHKIDVTGGQPYVFEIFNSGTTAYIYVVEYDEDDQFVKTTSITATGGTAYKVVTLDAATTYVRMSLLSQLLGRVIFVPGSTAPEEYIPYHRTETPIYIGDTQLMQDEYVSYREHTVYKSISLYGIEDNIDTLDLSTGILTQKVKKIVLNGTEDFVYQNYAYKSTFVLDIPDISLLTFRVFSNYFQGGDVLPLYNQRRDQIFVTLHPQYKHRAIAIGTATWNGNVTAFKDFLAEKYASGNPVTVWYVLESPEITNLPVSPQASGTLEGYLAQDGVPSSSNPIYPTYARTHYPTDPPVPLPALPTTDGETIIDYDDTLKPSQMYVKYKKRR